MKTIITLVSIGIVVLGCNTQPPVTSDDFETILTTSYFTSSDPNLTYFFDSEAGIRIVKGHAKQLQYFFDGQNTKTLKDVAHKQQLSVAVNGGYFVGDYTDAVHAGLLVLQGIELAPLATLDPQISHVVLIDSSGQPQFLENSKYKHSNSTQTAFQTGPLILDQGEIQQNLITASTNGMSEHKRTVLGTTAGQDIFLLVTSRAYSLADLAEYITHSELFAGEAVSAINLDGGFSTAMFSAEFNNFNHNSSWFLPAVIGFCESTCK